jgi:hypothetical protein
VPGEIGKISQVDLFLSSGQATCSPLQDVL